MMNLLKFSFLLLALNAADITDIMNQFVKDRPQGAYVKMAFFMGDTCKQPITPEDVAKYPDTLTKFPNPAYVPISKENEDKWCVNGKNKLKDPKGKLVGGEEMSHGQCIPLSKVVPVPQQLLAKLFPPELHIELTWFGFCGGKPTDQDGVPGGPAGGISGVPPVGPGGQGANGFESKPPKGDYVKIEMFTDDKCKQLIPATGFSNPGYVAISKEDTEKYCLDGNKLQDPDKKWLDGQKLSNGHCLSAGGKSLKYTWSGFCSKSKPFPWWAILLIVVAGLALIGSIGYCICKKKNTSGTGKCLV